MQGYTGTLVFTVEVLPDSGYYSLYVNGKRLVDRESFTVADNIRRALLHPEEYSRPSEALEVAESIVAWLAKAGA